MTRPSRLVAALFGGSILVGATLTLAHGGATGIVKQRMDLMDGIGERMKTLASIFKGEVDYDPAVVQEAAAGIRDHAGDDVLALFPEGSLDAPTEALPSIWEDWAQFEQLAHQLEAYGDALVQAADNPRASDGGMMGGARGMMMGEGRGMMMGQGHGMMMGSVADGPDPAMLATMPPEAAFMHLSETCNSCHTRFRVEKDH